MAARRFSVQPRGPFDLRASNKYFGGWVQAAEGDEPAIPMAFPVEGWDGSAVVVVRQADDGTVSGEVFGTTTEHERAWQQACAVLSVDEDGSGFADAGRRDPMIGTLQAQHPGLRPVLFHSPYEAACQFVIAHRTSIAQGRAVRARMAEQAGDAIETPLGVHHSFPAPQRLLQMEAFPGVFAAKWPRLHAVAQAALDGVLVRAHLRSLPYEQALAAVRAIPGMGPFFSQGVVIRGAGAVDALSDDMVTRQAVQQAYGLDHEPDTAELTRIAEPWRPYRSWVMVLLHVAFRREGAGPRRQR
ncbi:MAG: DNA-3-methyladenine glycosylase 2 family protein [Candidatus Dormibacteraeota bacterium]|nr:DNA-3-methyladenine glycosylase 2 family protein [Candidatus Dormibacteraeota bacterium]MBV9526040.1 DNA-3-methyladenine glycosylase 2 family protein [Candidatus Dormibacteraeota bacterium]